MLVRYVKALCPQQAIDDYTPDAWHEVIGHLDLDKCREAVTSAARRSPFIAPAELIAEIAAKRSVGLPHSNACREGDCRECHVSWCNCTCHPQAVEAITSPNPGPRPVIARRGADAPRQIGPGDFGRSP